jgi:hypothetical protein
MRVFCKQDMVIVIQMVVVVGSGVADDKHITCA